MRVELEAVFSSPSLNVSKLLINRTDIAMSMLTFVITVTFRFP